jgi:PadR family transcriptional regulator AphA
MSLRHALLGLLAQQSASGFDLTKTFEHTLSPWAWHSTHSHIYPELRRMREAGLVEVTETASRGRKTYAITEQGRAELREWMLAPAETEMVRSAAALRLFLVGTLEPAEARSLLQRYVDRTTEQLEALRAQMDAAGAEWRENPLAVGRLAAERGLRTLPAVRDWALWGIEQLDRTERD